MKMHKTHPRLNTPPNCPAQVTRREAIRATGQVLAGMAGLAALSPLPGVSRAASAPAQPAPAAPPAPAVDPGEKLRVASCQFPVSGDPSRNAAYIQDFLRQAAAAGAHLLHTSEACLSGYAGCDLPSYENYDWEALRKEAGALRKLARELKLWLVLGSAHLLLHRRRPATLFGRRSPGDAGDSRSPDWPGHLL